MWGDEAVSGSQQRIVGTGWLGGEHIQSGGIDFVIIQSFCQVMLVDQRTTAGIDLNGIGLHQFQATGVNQVTC